MLMERRENVQGAVSAEPRAENLIITSIKEMRENTTKACLLSEKLRNAVVKSPNQF